MYGENGGFGGWQGFHWHGVAGGVPERSAEAVRRDEEEVMGALVNLPRGGEALQNAAGVGSGVQQTGISRCSPCAWTSHATPASHGQALSCPSVWGHAKQFPISVCDCYGSPRGWAHGPAGAKDPNALGTRVGRR